MGDLKKIALLGSTGSIGRNVLNVARAFPEKFRIIALAAGSFNNELERQIKEFKPEVVCLGDGKLPHNGFGKTKFLSGIEGLKETASLESADLILSAVVGAVGIHPLVSAIKSGKKIALANKEALVIAGDVINLLLKRKKGDIIPVDSEHSAIFQCLLGHDRDAVNRIIITASGGALYKKNKGNISVNAALRHPTWKMGKKITIDSATLMNKGLEVIETHFLFGVPYEKIDVLIHPQSLVHSMVEFIDGSVLAQLTPTDMRYAIQYAMSYPSRWQHKNDFLKLEKIKTLTFEKPDFRNFPCFKIALAAAASGGVMPAVMNAANEVAVEGFLTKRIKYSSIPAVIEKTIGKFRNLRAPSLDEILSADAAARRIASALCHK